MPTFESEIIREARTVAKLQREATKIRRRLKDINAELRHAKKNIRALMQCNATGEPMPPLRVYGESPAGLVSFAKVKA